MRELGIYYWNDDANIQKGRAMIIGPEGTPYAFCPLIFSLEFPPDYPFVSPRVQIMTSDGHTRFHPNLYVGGKVCLSILGTWQGPAWASTMSISTVLKSIQSLLEANPIVNEPGWEKYKLTEPKAAAYAAWVQWGLTSYSHSLLRIWQRDKNVGHVFAEFAEELEEIGPALLISLEGIIRAKAEKGDELFETVPYNMGGTTNWKGLCVNCSSV